MALNEARRASGLTQAGVASASGISQPRISELEAGLGRAAPLETWAILAAVVGDQLVSYLEIAPGADQPRDLEHLRRQNAVVGFAAPGGWVAAPEPALDATAGRPRSIDVALIRAPRREAVVVEIWDWFDDVGAGLRGLDVKVAALRSRLNAGATEPPELPWTVRGLYVVRATRRNRLLVRDLAALFAARFPAVSREWLAALRDSNRPMPSADGFLWSTTDGVGFTASRLRYGVRARSAGEPARRRPAGGPEPVR